MTARRRRWPRFLGAVCAIAVLGLIGAELAVRAWYPIRLEKIALGAVRLSENPVVMYELQPSFNDHNRWGLRGADCTPEKPAGVFRILAVGDAVTYGQGVHVQETYPVHLQRKLNASEKRFPGIDRFEVLNFGVTGYSIIQEAEQVRARGMDFDPDLVVLLVCLNDWDPGAVEFQALIGSQDHAGMRFLSSYYNPANSPLRTRMYASQLFRHVVARLRRTERFEGPPEWTHAFVDQIGRKIAQEPSVLRHYLRHEYFNEHFKGLRDHLAERGVPLIAVLMPQNREAGEEEYRMRLGVLENLCAHPSTELVDFLARARVQQQRRGVENVYDGLFLRGDVHLTNAGLELVAETLQEPIHRAIETRPWRGS